MIFTSPDQIDTKQAGFSYIEVMISIVLIAIMLVPAMNALQTGIESTTLQSDLSAQQLGLQNKMETLMSESYVTLLSAAETAGDKNTISTVYSDAAGSDNRILVYLALYDPTNTADPFSITDPNTDGDSNAFTGDTADVLWLQASAEGSYQSLQALRVR